VVGEEGDDGAKNATGDDVRSVVAVVYEERDMSKKRRRMERKANEPMVRLTAMRVAPTGGMIAIHALTV
jgi:hypothetical protein